MAVIIVMMIMVIMNGNDVEEETLLRRVIRPGGNYRTMTICNDLNSISRYDVDNQWLVHGGNPRLV